MARLRVGGQLLHEFTRVSGLRWRHGIDGGCLSAEWTVSRRPSSMTHPAFKRGALVEVFHGLQRVWVGRLSEPGDDTSQLYATGLLAQADGYMAFDGTAVTDDVDDALTYATANGLSLTYLGDAPANVVPAEEPRVLGRADEDFATRVHCRYISSVAGTPPVPDGYAVAEKINADAEAVYDRSTLYVDITDRGLLTATEAGWIAQGILDKFGARLSFTSGVTVNSRQLVTVGGGRVALQTIRAGQMVRFLGARTPSSFAGGAFDVVIGSTDYTDGSGEITLNPLGLVPRTLADIIASVPTIHTALNPMPGAGAVQAA